MRQALAFEALAGTTAWATLLALGIDAWVLGVGSVALVVALIAERMIEVWPSVDWAIRQRVRHTLLLLSLAVVGIFATALLMALGPRAFGSSSYIVYGSSMEPAIPVGSVSVAKPTQPDALNVGDIVVFKPDHSVGLPTTHRIVGIQEIDGVRAFQLKGDANPEPDPGWAVLDNTGGKVLYSVPYIGYLLDFTSRHMGNAAFIWLPALLLTAVLLLEVWVPKSQEEQGKLRMAR